ncbi:MAG: nicotinate phosphoribosyltransferase [Candidatus Binatota bacterium]|jgi:nicotinate phosphoribosyltransferase|nr:nicotinate phosphoribosyltransferase [Candidatus Binatota bacterium]
MRSDSWVDDSNAPLLTDLYQLVMLQAYFAADMRETAVFDLFVRRLPEARNYLVACGLDDALRHLEHIAFDAEAIAALRRLGRFSESFLEWLAELRFRGDVRAVPEGTVVFAEEPILEVVAPLPEAQLVETLVLNQIHLQTVAASKAARIVGAAAGRNVVDFGLRRMHGTDAAMKSARAFHVGGVAATSNVLAASVYGVPVAGTMAHSFVQAHDDELDAFRAMVASTPDAVLLVDTYDTIGGVRNVIRLARELGNRFRVRAIRLDSGDLAASARDARRMLDEAGLAAVRIFASSDLDEYRIRDLVAAGPPIDAFGVGTRMGVSSDAPSLDAVYKLAAYAGRGRVKLSTDKRTFPGRKQVFRVVEGGEARRDVLAVANEPADGRPLLVPVMQGGRRLAAGSTDLEEARERCRRGIAELPERLRDLGRADPPYPVERTPALENEWSELRDRIAQGRSQTSR